MRIIVDGFGGDNAPKSVLEGCAQAVSELGVEIAITGDADKLAKTAAELGVPLEGIELIDAPDILPMDADPVSIRREYKNSSMARGCRMLADGEGDAFVTAGSTGAAVVGASTIVRRLKGVKRAAIGTVVPCEGGCFMLLDSGANHECRPEMLRQFGIMGSAYMERVMGIKAPRVGVVNIGTEPTKGTDLQIEANRLLAETSLNFIGNVEARELPLGGCDVAVCDGFTGNVILKLTEGLAKMFMGRLKRIFMSSLPTKLAAGLVKKDLSAMKKDFDYSEYGGAMLLGARKPVIKAHGSSDAKAVKNAIRQAARCCEQDIIGRIAENIAEFSDTEADGEE